MQIFDYETKYLESCNPAGSALKGEQCMHQWLFGLWWGPTLVFVFCHLQDSPCQCLPSLVHSACNPNAGAHVSIPLHNAASCHSR